MFFRHGLARVLHFEPNVASSQEEVYSLETLIDALTRERTEFVGFYSEGKVHGLGYFTWSPGSPSLPFRCHALSCSHLGQIRCIQQHVKGRFHNEFNFHRVDLKMTFCSMI